MIRPEYQHSADPLLPFCACPALSHMCPLIDHRCTLPELLLLPVLRTRFTHSHLSYSLLLLIPFNHLSPSTSSWIRSTSISRSLQPANHRLQIPSLDLQIPPTFTPVFALTAKKTHLETASAAHHVSIRHSFSQIHHRSSSIIIQSCADATLTALLPVILH